MNDATANNKSAFDRLTDQSRIRGATRMIAEGARPEAVTAEQVQSVVQNVSAYKARRERDGRPLSIGQIAKAVGYAPATISTVLAGKYKGDTAEVAIELDRWLDDQVKRDEAPTDVTFVRTRVAQDIMTVADAAITLGTIGLVYGGKTSGVGKTMALQAIRDEKAGALMITIEKVEASTTGVLWAIAHALRISTGHNNRFMYHRIKDILRDTPRLLLVDQIHNLCGAKGDKPLYVLADLHDATRAPQLWCGTTDIVDYLQRGEARNQEPLAQIRRRIGISVDLMARTGPDGGGQPLYTIDEIRQVFARNKMRLTPDAARYLYALANVPNSGALGACRNLVVMATAIHGKSGQAVLTADMLRAVHKLMVAGKNYTRLSVDIAEMAPAAVKVG